MRPGYLRPDYAADEAEAARRQSRTPVASGLLARVHDALTNTRDEATRQELESLALSVGLFVKHGKEVSAEGARLIEARLRKLAGADA